ncbi:ATP12 family protein [Neokomagataea thailandica]|uniref:ATP synthase F1 mitochondrial assembly chaperone n=1 Tax=Neokomagataea tanensis NBRC 106556 TaxID=1223519 RepID=A0ABQ0QLI8_9PROT|nr:ATP12 family protein [Neokomagataea thailandica]GBR49338.1 ATP synthase F1 mitochondrial assembly chaperone [Neokomagataea tanensis NBRC 106556]
MSAKRRFWKTVSVQEKQEDGQGLVYMPVLDERPIRLPKGSVLALEKRGLADAIAAEWARIGEGSFQPDALPLTRIAGTMIERIRPDLSVTRAALLSFGLDDALCYDGGTGEPAVQALFGWLEERGLRPVVTAGLMPVTQSDAYVTALTQWLARCDEAELAVLGVLAQAGGSLLVGYALLEGGLTSEQAVAIITADERKQEAVWGGDKELTATIQTRQNDVRDAVSFLRLSR